MLTVKVPTSGRLGVYKDTAGTFLSVVSLLSQQPATHISCTFITLHKRNWNEYSNYEILHYVTSAAPPLVNSREVS
jgi:hypothetical protein